MNKSYQTRSALSIPRRSFISTACATFISLHIARSAKADSDGILDQSENPLEAISGPVGDFSRQGGYGQPAAGNAIEIKGTSPISITMAAPVNHVNGEIPVVIAVHGANQSPQSMWSLSAHLASHGFFVIIPDIMQKSLQDTVDALHDVMRSLPFLSDQTGYRLKSTEAVFIAKDSSAAACIALTGGNVQGVVGKSWVASCLITSDMSEEAQASLSTYSTPVVSILDATTSEDTISAMEQTPSEGLRTLVAIKGMTNAIFDEVDELNPVTYYWRSYLGCTVAAYSHRDSALLDLVTGSAYKNITHSVIQVAVA